mmetsp:Transcript_70782/g.162277  ORF Transcript_70782/g.162277 Transcript_70782/m.162277 type:complete len:486 (-) Transcript_70782:351-1808(-)
MPGHELGQPLTGSRPDECSLQVMDGTQQITGGLQMTSSIQEATSSEQAVVSESGANEPGANEPMKPTQLKISWLLVEALEDITVEVKPPRRRTYVVTLKKGERLYCFLWRALSFWCSMLVAWGSFLFLTTLAFPLLDMIDPPGLALIMILIIMIIWTCIFGFGFWICFQNGRWDFETDLEAYVVQLWLVGLICEDVTPSAVVRAQRRAEAELARTRFLNRAKGISVAYLVSKLEEELIATFGHKYNESTTFVDLATMLWGPPEKRFEKTVDFLGHASMKSRDRDGEKGVSLCTAISSRDQNAVSDATHFISWTWRYPVSKFLATLAEYCRAYQYDTSKTFVWICFFCNDQFEWLSGGSSDGVAAFGRMLQHIGKVVCVVDDFVAARAAYFSRVWTVFEVFTAFTNGIEVDLALMVDSRQRLMKESLSSLKTALVVDVMSAQATDPNDEQRIKMLISAQDGGADKTNQTVKQLFVDLIAKVLMSSS